jgi:hypothetical protein
MRPTAPTALAVTCAVVLSGLLTGCASSQGGSPRVKPAATVSRAPTTPAPTAAGTPAASPTSNARGVATPLDPCQLVTAAEASALAGASYSASEKRTNPGGGKQCVYGGQTHNVFMVSVARAASPAQARSEWATSQVQARALVSQSLPPGLHVTLRTANVSGLGDRTATVFGRLGIQGRTIGFSGIYVLQGATFFAFSDLLDGHAPPSTAAMTTQARTTLGRLT